MFVKVYNEAREHEGINGLTPSEMFLQSQLQPLYLQALSSEV
jgi:hypothetical protein